MLQRMTRAPSRQKAALVVGSLIVALGLASACNEPTGVDLSHPLRVRGGDTISAALGANESAGVFSFVGEADSEFAVFFQALGDSLMLLVTDSASGSFVQFAASASGTTPLDRVATYPFGGLVSHTYLIRVKGFTAHAAGQFRFWIYHVHRAPEHRSATFLLGDTVVGERLENVADVDEFTFRPESTGDVTLMLQALGPGKKGQLLALSLEDSLHYLTGYLAAVTSVVGDTSLDGQSTTRVTLTAQPYTVRVYTLRDSYDGSALDQYVGPYRFWVRSVDRAPEHVAATVAPGDTVTGEAIDYVGDVDEFTLVGTPGEAVNVFFQATGGSPTTTLRLDVASDPYFVHNAVSSGADTSLTQNATGHYILPSPGRAILRVSGGAYGTGSDHGPYRLYVYPVNPAPEHVPATV